MPIRNFKYIIFINFFVFIFVGICLGQQTRLSPDVEAVLAAVPDNEIIPVIIHLTDQVDLKSYKQTKNKTLRRSALIKALKDKRDKSQKELIAFLKANKIDQTESFWIFNGMSVELPAHLVRELALRPEVSRITLDNKITAPVVTTAALGGTELNIEMTGAPQLWDLGFDGSGVVVATMDTGVDYLHPDIGPKWRGGTNSWFDPYGEHLTPYDPPTTNGHGTGVMGVVLGGDAGGTSIGVAPGAQWIAVKIYDDNGTGDISGIHQGFQWLLDPDENPDTDDAPDIVNNSWYLLNTVDRCETEFANDVAALKSAEIAVVFSAGNTGPAAASSVSPANNSGSLSVGATDLSGFATDISGRGPSACEGSGVYPGLAAPGANIKTAYLTFGGVSPDPYIYSVSGTSYAAPHVTGAMALLLSAAPDLTISELESTLKLSALDIEEEGPDNASGYGLVDAMEAYMLLGDIIQPGTDIQVTPADGINITFTEITTGGIVTVNELIAPAAPAGYRIVGTVFDLDFTGVSNGPVSVCFDYDETGVQGTEENLKLLHKDAGGLWQDITTSVDTANNIICGEITSFSEFAVAEPLTISGDDGCFIATAAYGSYWEDHVMILREFRDFYLMNSRIGSAFVKAYYRYSPPAAVYIADHEGMRFIVRGGLAPLVAFSWLALNYGMLAVFMVLLGILTTIVGCSCLLLKKKKDGVSKNSC